MHKISGISIYFVVSSPHFLMYWTNICMYSPAITELNCTGCWLLIPMVMVVYCIYLRDCVYTEKVKFIFKISLVLQFYFYSLFILCSFNVCSMLVIVRWTSKLFVRKMETKKGKFPNISWGELDQLGCFSLFILHIIIKMNEILRKCKYMKENKWEILFKKVKWNILEKNQIANLPQYWLAVRVNSS